MCEPDGLRFLPTGPVLSGGAFLLASQAGYAILLYDARFAVLDMEDRHGDRKIQAAPDRRDSDQV